jgi:NADH:ubiquinone oxidoreductase subunit 5 (subunit L)/multisubunit Na+/H+ antiporter MnhA subunit
MGWIIFFLSWGDIHHLTPPEGNYPVPLWTLPTGSSALKIGFQVDTLTALMLFMVPFVCLIIFIYSKGYMGIGNPAEESGQRGWPAPSGYVDPLASRFFG